MIGSRVFIAALAATALGATAQAQTTPATPTTTSAESAADSTQLLGGVAAIVNDEVISLSDVGERARLLLITLGVPASEENLQQALPRALEELIDERLQLQKAAEYEVEISEAEVEDAARNIASQNQATVQELYDDLRNSGVNPETLKDQMRAEIAWRRIMGGLYGSRIRISRLQIDSMLERLSASATEERYQLAEIFLFAPTEADKQQILQGANVIVEQLRQGARFQLAAQQYSNSPTAAVGGDLGWVSPSELEPEVQAVLADMEPPALTTPIVVEDGVYIYAMRARQDGFEGAREVDLRQVLSTDGNRAALNNLTLSQTSCDGLQEAADNAGLIYAELGRVPEAALTEEVQNAIYSVPEGGASGIVDTAAGPAILYVCDRGQAGVQLPSRDQIEDRLYSQQLNMLSQRDLRDLKREATIIRR